MSCTSNQSSSKDLSVVIKKSPQIYDDVLLKLSSKNVLTEEELLLLKRDLLFTTLVVIMLENGFQAIKGDGEVFDPDLVDIKQLSKWKLSSGLYEAEFVMLGYNEVSTKLILVPLSSMALVNAAIKETSADLYSVCLPIDKHIVFPNGITEVSQMFYDLEQLSNSFKNSVVSPVKSRILNICGYPGPSLFELPEDIISKIMFNLQCPDILNVAVTCKKFNQILSENNFWHKLFIRDCCLFMEILKPDSLNHNDWRILYITSYTAYVRKKQREERIEEMRQQRRERFLHSTFYFPPSNISI